MRLANIRPKGGGKIPTPTNGGMQHLTYINEPNLYREMFTAILQMVKQADDQYDEKLYGLAIRTR